MGKLYTQINKQIVIQNTDIQLQFGRLLGTLNHFHGEKQDKVYPYQLDDFWGEAGCNVSLWLL